MANKVEETDFKKIYLSHVKEALAVEDPSFKAGFSETGYLRKIPEDELNGYFSTKDSSGRVVLKPIMVAIIDGKPVE